MRARAALVAGALLVSLQVGAPAAEALVVSCAAGPQTVSGKVKLENDLLNCPDGGLIVGQDGTSIDLNGRTIDGDRGSAADIGISIGGRTGVKVKNGIVKQFGIGISISGGEGKNKIDKVVVHDNITYGVHVFNSDKNKITKSLATRTQPAGYGIVIDNGADLNTIKSNEASANDGGIILLGSTNTVVSNMTNHNDFVGISVSAGAANEVEKNEALDSGVDGIVVAPGATATRVESNVAGLNTQDGVDVQTADATVTKNDADDNSVYGIRAVAGVSASQNTAKGNNNSADPVQQCLNVTCTGAVAATNATCGVSVSADLKLNGDLMNCPANALEVQAGVTLDLNGHTVDGQGAGTGAHGIFAGVGANGVTVRNGTVKDHLRGVFAGSPSDFTVEDVTIHNNTNGLIVGEDRCVVTKNLITGNGVGVQVNGVDDCEMKMNEVGGNGIGLSYNDGDTGVFEKNRIVFSGMGGASAVNSEGNVFKQNVLLGNGTDGMRLDDDDQNLFTGNICSLNLGSGLAIGTAGNTVTKNTARANASYGMDVTTPIDGGGNRASGNDVGQCLGVTCTP